MRIKLFIALIIVILALTLSLAACDFLESLKFTSSDSVSTDKQSDDAQSGEETSHTHTWGEWTVTKTPTCTETGSRERTCSGCEEVEREVLDMVAHTEVVDAAVPATCTTTGLTEGKHCAVCGAILIAQQELPMAHTYGEWITATEPTCTAEGAKQRTCAICGDGEIQTIATVAHNYIDGACIMCGKKQPSVGLSYTYDDTTKSYTVSGIGSCTDYDVIIPATYNDTPVTSIEYMAFSGCSGLTSVTIPDSVTSIGWVAFSDCSGLTSVTIGSGVTSIVDMAFKHCSRLTSVTIGGSVTSIGRDAFFDCSRLTDICYAGTKAQWNAISKGSGWNSSTGNYTIHCSDGDLAK